MLLRLPRPYQKPCSRLSPPGADPPARHSWPSPVAQPWLGQPPLESCSTKGKKPFPLTPKGLGRLQHQAMSHPPVAPQACRQSHFRLEGILTRKAAPRVAVSSPSHRQKRSCEALMWFPTKDQAQQPKEALPLPRGAVATQVSKTTGKLSQTSGWPLLEVGTSRTGPSDAEMPRKGSCQPVSA